MSDTGTTHDDRLVLASGSPRRRELLSQIEVEYESIPPELDEESFRISDPHVLVTSLARAKAGAVRTEVPRLEHRWILAADTVVVVDDTILGKPKNRDSAYGMMKLLSGRGHVVLTGIAVWPPEAPEPDVRAADTEVWFADISDAELEAYLNTNDWSGVAGGYRIQGHAARHIHHIQGSYSNVVGLPIHLVYSILRQHGFPGFDQSV